MNVHSHYETLSVARNAPSEVIRAAYKALSQKWHPDKNSDPEAADAMRAINVAHETLSDLTKRRQYDDWLEAEEMRWTFSNPTVQAQRSTYTRAPRPKTERAAPRPDGEQTPPQPKRRGTPFEIDDWLFTQAMRNVKPVHAKWSFTRSYFRICALYGALGIAALFVKLTFAG